MNEALLMKALEVQADMFGVLIRFRDGRLVLIEREKLTDIKVDDEWIDFGIHFYDVMVQADKATRDISIAAIPFSKNPFGLTSALFRKSHVVSIERIPELSTLSNVIRESRSGITIPKLVAKVRR